MSSSGNGQLRPAASNRRMVSRTVEGAAPIRRAISRLGSPAAFILITSRTRRIASLSVGIQGPPSQSRKGDRKGARRGLVTRATSSRNGGRHHSHPSRIGCELMEAGVESLRKDSFDVIAVALDGFFAAVLPDQMCIKISIPGLPESDVRDRRTNWHRRSGTHPFCLPLILRMPAPANLGQVLLGSRARSSGRHLAGVADGKGLLEHSRSAACI